MPRYSLVFDAGKCVGCSICIVACKQEYGLPVGVSRIRVTEVGPKEAEGKLHLEFSLTHCRHCRNAPCIAACPRHAIGQRQDGIMTLTQEDCDGCQGGPQRCLEVCPFAAPQVNPEDGKVEICSLCADRIDQGLEPVCVKHCISGALRFETKTGNH